MVRTAPHEPRAIKVGATGWKAVGRMVHRRRSPKPPSLRRRAARIIEPAVGASTWALGSHRWSA